MGILRAPYGSPEDGLLLLDDHNWIIKVFSELLARELGRDPILEDRRKIRELSKYFHPL